MCCRYVLHKPEEAVAAIAEALEMRLDTRNDHLQPRYNVAPSQTAPVVATETGAASLKFMSWGLVPPADRDLPKPRRLVNARAETLMQWPAFRSAAASRRCLIPVNGFYEFKSLGREKEPYLFVLGNDEPMALAGLWEPASGEIPATFCIVTTAPNATMAPIHHRMPVVLTRRTMGQWLGARPLAEAAVAQVTRPVAAESLVARRLARYVNNSRDEGPQCLADPEAELF